MLLLLLSPAGGDDLQASKRGIMEVADAIVVNKADGEYAASAKRTAMDYSMAMKLSRRRIPFWDPPVICCSSLTGVGIEEVWEACERFREVNTVRGELERCVLLIFGPCCSASCEPLLG
jgi:LAO/AO transport system kinase